MHHVRCIPEQQHFKLWKSFDYKKNNVEEQEKKKHTSNTVEIWDAAHKKIPLN